jgi:hypothetical protein
LTLILATVRPASGDELPLGSGTDILRDYRFFTPALPFARQSYAGWREFVLPVTSANVNLLPMIAREASSNL